MNISRATYKHISLCKSETQCFENAKQCGRLELQSRNLKCFPKSDLCIIEDLKFADLSRNKLTELPQECTEYYSMERLILYHNMIRNIPDSVICLHSLQFLDLSRNQLSYLPDSLCQLPSLEVLIVNNNRLVSLPEEIGKMQSLSELDASCNEITHLPVQIGDMTHLRSLNLRRNHLQEIPVEISFLRLIHMDLSANRITTLPVELRFMNSVVDLSLGENPLSCPPANLCSRGKVHVFKYLEIQAIKEDRKRGVLTDSEYRRSYRHKASAGQLNDFRFANGFGADARRKRHTADSGYGSEQPLDRRWSQDFSQDDNKYIDVTPIENDPGRSLHVKSTEEKVVKEHQQLASTDEINNSQRTIRENSDGLEELERDERRMIASKLLERQGQIKEQPKRVKNNSVKNAPSLVSPSGNIPIKIEHQGYSSSNIQKAKAITSTENGLKHYEHSSDMSKSNFAINPMQISTQNTISNSKFIHSSSSSSSSTYSVASSSTNASTIRIPTSPSSTSTSSSSLAAGNSESGNIVAANTSIKKTSSYDVKAFQKEAVLSYVKAKQSSPAHSVASLQSHESSDNKSGVMAHRSASPRISSTSTSRSAQQLAHGVSSLITSHKNALAQHNINNQTNSSIPQPFHTNGVKQSIGKSPQSSSPACNKQLDSGITSQKQVAVRRDPEKSTTADSHIAQLKMHVESRLRISLPENLSTALADGVILCHVANHVRPRAVPSIHVPSPAVPKLNTAKCRRNVENFLLACKRIGVREDLICSPSDVLEPRKQGTVRVAITVSELLRFYQSRATPGTISGMATHISSGQHLTISSGVHL